MYQISKHPKQPILNKQHKHKQQIKQTAAKQQTSITSQNTIQYKHTNVNVKSPQIKATHNHHHKTYKQVKQTQTAPTNKQKYQILYTNHPQNIKPT